MATLSKNGTEIARLIRHLPDTEDATDRVVRLSVRSNGYILKASYCTFKLSQSFGPKRHTWGWKRFAKLKENGNVDRLIENYLQQGWQKES